MLTARIMRNARVAQTAARACAAQPHSSSATSTTQRRALSTAAATTPLLPRRILASQLQLQLRCFSSSSPSSSSSSSPSSLNPPPPSDTFRAASAASSSLKGKAPTVTGEFAMPTGSPVAPLSSVADSTTLAAAASPAASSTTTKESRWTRIKKNVETNRVKWINFSLAGGITFGIYSLYSFGFNLTDFYLEERELDAPYLAFLTGAATSLLAVAGYRFSRRLFLLRASRAYRTVLKTAFASDAVRARFGDDVRAHTIRRMQRSGRNHAFDAPPVLATPESTASHAAYIASLASPLVAPHMRYVSFIAQAPASRPWRDAWPRWFASRRLQFLLALHGTSPVDGHEVAGVLQAETEHSLRNDWEQINVLLVDCLERGEQIVVTKHGAADVKRKQDLMDPQHEKTAGDGGGVMRDREILSKIIVKQ